jgi:DNA-binding CsgD family transcriptional regulator
MLARNATQAVLRSFLIRVVDPMASAAKPGARPQRIADFFEAAYDLEREDQSWLRGVMEAAVAVFGRGIAAHGAIYDASDVAAFRVQNAEFIGLSPQAIDCLMRGLGLMSPAFVARTFRSLLANSSRGDGVALPELGPMYDELAPHGLVDAFNLNGLDPSGIGTFFAMWTDRAVEVSQAEREMFRRMAHHLGAAHRVRRRLRASQPGQAAPDPTLGAEAILDARKRVVHAEGGAQQKAAREELIAAATARDRACGPRAEPAESLSDWRPLTRARWTLVDHFERGGARYIIARENQSCIEGLESLTDRERQAVVYLALGQSTKETAYALGVSAVTVRVLLARAAARLGVRSRAELLAHAEVRRLSPGGNAQD